MGDPDNRDLFQLRMLSAHLAKEQGATRDRPVSGLMTANFNGRVGDGKQKVRGKSSHFGVGGDHSARSGDRPQAEPDGWLERRDPNRLQTLPALLDLELNLLTLVQSAVAFSRNFRLVDENVRAGGPSDEAVALGCVEPLDGSGFSIRHVLVLLVTLRWVSGHRGCCF